MANLFSNSSGGALSHLMAALKGNVGTSCTYRRGATVVTGGITATKASALRTQGIEQVHLDADEQDWIVAAADLVISAVTVTPQRGDRIEPTGAVYEVLGGSGVPAYEPVDPHGVMLRIHTKRIS